MCTDHNIRALREWKDENYGCIRRHLFYYNLKSYIVNKDLLLTPVYYNNKLSVVLSGKNITLFIRQVWNINCKTEWYYKI